MTSSDSPEAGIGWHDNIIYSIHFVVGDAASGEWWSNLVLDIDHITEWVCGTEGKALFRVAPATLTFRDVADLRLSLDFAGGAHPRTLNELSIDGITSEPLPPDKAPGRMPYRRWRIGLNLPQGGEIAFGSSGYGQMLRSEPVLRSEQRLPARERPPLMVDGK